MNWETCKKLAVQRDDGRCLKCLGAATDVHHRKIRGMGGSKTLNIPANLICLCRQCHDYIHSHPDESYTSGFLVRSGYDPADVPVWMGQQWKIQLTEDWAAVGEACALF